MIDKIPTLALTLWRPWPYAFFYLGDDCKRVENRPWAPWERVIGTRIALHAGKHYDKEAHRRILGLRSDPRAEHEGIVGTGIVRGWVKDAAEDQLFDINYGGLVTADEAQQAYTSHWFFGPFGWIFVDCQPLKRPVPCRGAQGLWKIPESVREQMR
jgi:hypothetical protein